MGIRFIEIYDNGTLVSGLSISGAGDTVKYTKENNTIPQFKGGGNAFAEYLSKNIKYPLMKRNIIYRARCY
jgi:predicted alpha/beta superfamily hydrolase